MIAYKKSWYGYHYYDIPAGAVDPIESSKWGFANAVVYNPILGLIKASFVITLLKLRSPNNRIQIALWTIFTVNAIFTIAAPLVCAFQCRPISKFWDRTKPGTCLDGPKYTYGTISVVIITDVAVVVMPTWILHRLQMPLRKKVMIISFLSFGVAVTAIGAYRLYVFVNFYSGRNLNPDASYGMKQGLSNMEVSLASIGACGGTVKWLLGRCMPFFRDGDVSTVKRFGASRSSGGNGAGTNGSGGESGFSTMASQISEPGPRPQVVWKRAEYRRRDQSERLSRAEGARSEAAEGRNSTNEGQTRERTTTTDAYSRR